MPENDKLTTTLDALRSDIERTPMADSLAVRRRGDQRTRRQAVGGALAVVALVAGAAGIYGGVGGLDRADAPPATGNPTASTEVEQPLALADQPLMDPADIGAIGPYTGWQANPEPLAADQQLQQCLPVIRSLGADRVESRMFYNDLEPTVYEHALQFADVAGAQGALEELSRSFAACPPGDPDEASVADRGPSTEPSAAGADLALHASRTATPVQASEVSYYELGVARKGNLLVVVQFQGGPLDDVDWVWDADRLQTALDRATA